MEAAKLVVCAAAALAMVSGFFGVVVARVMWADDLKQAQRIDKIRSKTELALRSQIDSLQRQLALVKPKS